jgi:hypothetical protein
MRLLPTTATYPRAGVHPSARAGVRAAFGGVINQPAPPVAMSSFRGPRHTLEVMADKASGPRGEQSFRVRQFTEAVVRQLEPKDYLGEILACRNVFLQRSPQSGAPLFRYMNDPRHVELVKDPERMVEEIEMFGSTQVDCDEIACLAATMCMCLGREVELVALGFSPGSLSHVACRVKEPKSGRWIFIDPVAGPKERDAAQRAQEIRYWSVD